LITASFFKDAKKFMTEKNTDDQPSAQ